jgi:HK97 gp10 family phage protein
MPHVESRTLVDVTKLPGKLRDEIERELRAGGKAIVSDAKARVPKAKAAHHGHAPGAARRSVKMTLYKKTGLRLRVKAGGTAAPHFHLVENGTVKMAARPSLRPAAEAGFQKLEAAMERLPGKVLK